MVVIETCPECGHYLQNAVYTINPPIPYVYCPSCGWRATKIRTPYVGYDFGSPVKQTQNAEAHNDEPIANGSSDCQVACPFNPKNGGDGICFCTFTDWRYNE